MIPSTALTYLHRIRAGLPATFDDGFAKREAMDMAIKAVEIIEAWQEDQDKDVRLRSRQERRAIERENDRLIK